MVVCLPLAQLELALDLDFEEGVAGTVLEVLEGSHKEEMVQEESLGVQGTSQGAVHHKASEGNH